MKKLILIVICFISFNAIAQTKTNINEKSCFCCGDLYNLPTPTINGPTKINCGEGAKFTTNAVCQGANVVWAVTPSIPGVTQNPTTLTIPNNAPAGNYTIALQISCDRESVVRKEVKFTIEGVTNCVPDFLARAYQLPNGFITIETNPTTKTPGVEHWWGLQYNGTYPNCDAGTPIPHSTITSGNVWGGYINSAGTLSTYMGTGIAIVNTSGITYSGFQVNKCVKVTHYVKCCGQLYRQTGTISIGTNNLRTTGDKPVEIPVNIKMGQPELVK